MGAINTSSRKIVDIGVIDGIAQTNIPALNAAVEAPARRAGGVSGWWRPRSENPPSAALLQPRRSRP
jgi:hypothetical protein